MNDILNDTLRPAIVLPFILGPGHSYGNPKPDTFRRGEPKIGRNEPCPCGSGKKFKKCCIEKGGD